VNGALDLDTIAGELLINHRSVLAELSGSARKYKLASGFEARCAVGLVP